jgi:hypothetical protein
MTHVLVQTLLFWTILIPRIATFAEHPPGARPPLRPRRSGPRKSAAERARASSKNSRRSGLRPTVHVQEGPFSRAMLTSMALPSLPRLDNGREVTERDGRAQGLSGPVRGRPRWYIGPAMRLAEPEGAVATRIRVAMILR